MQLSFKKFMNVTKYVILGLLIIVFIRTLYETKRLEKEAASLTPLAPLPEGSLEDKIQFAINDVGSMLLGKYNTTKKIERVIAFGEPALPYLIQAIQKGNTRLMICIGGIARNGSTKARDFLVNTLKDQKQSIGMRASSLHGIMWAQDTKLFISMLDVLCDKETPDELWSNVETFFSTLTQEDLTKDLFKTCTFDEYMGAHGRDEINKRWKQYIIENLNFFYWCTDTYDKEHPYYFFVSIDQEAKAVGIPTEEYRKTHPWPNKDK
jgi:hypothetical protein